MPGGVKGGSQKVVRSLQEAIRCLPWVDRGPPGLPGGRGILQELDLPGQGVRRGPPRP